MIYLEEEVNDFHREDYYLAQIAAEIRRGNAKDPNSIDPKDLLLTFGPENEAVEVDPIVKQQMSRNFWFGKVGIPVPRNSNG